MVERLQWIKVRPDAVIDWWGVAGGGRALLQGQYPKARIETVEPTALLAERAMGLVQAPWWSRRRWGSRAPPVWLEQEAPRDARAQLVWANMMLHWRADPAAVFASWRAALAVDGFVMFSCFGPDTLRQLRALYRAQGWGPATHDFIDMHDLGDALVNAGFADPVMDMETLSVTWADAAAALSELRALGGNAAQRRHAGLRTPRWREQLGARMQQCLTGADGRLGLDLEIVYGHAFQPRPRVAVAKETRLTAEELQRMARRGRLRPTP